MRAAMDYANAAIGVISLVIAVVTLWKVQSVRRVQENERTLLRMLYGTETLGQQLRGAANHLAKNREPAVRELANDLLRTCGQIEGVSRALDADRGPATRGTAVTMVPTGYFTQDFLRTSVDTASSSVDIVVFRTMIVSTNHALAGLRDAARRGVRIRLLSLSSESPDSVLELTRSLLPWAGLENAAELRPQLAQSERRIVNHVRTWSAADQAKFGYRRYQEPPGLHMLRSDSTIKLGFAHLLSPDSTSTSLADRPHLEVAAGSKLGTYLTAHFEQLWSSAAGGALPR